MDEKNKSPHCGNNQTISSSPFSIFGNASVSVANNSAQTEFEGNEQQQNGDCLISMMGIIRKVFRF